MQLIRVDAFSLSVCLYLLDVLLIKFLRIIVLLYDLQGRGVIPQRSLVHCHGVGLLGHFSFQEMQLSLVVQVNRAGQELIALHFKNYMTRKRNFTKKLR